MTAEISIDSDAAPGTRDVIVTTPEGAFTLEDAFTVEGAKSGGVPVWIWPVLAVAVDRCGGGRIPPAATEAKGQLGQRNSMPAKACRV